MDLDLMLKSFIEAQYWHHSATQPILMLVSPWMVVEKKNHGDEANFMTEPMFSLSFGQITIKVEMRSSTIINLLCLKTDSYKSSLSGMESHWSQHKDSQPAFKGDNSYRHSQCCTFHSTLQSVSSQNHQLHIHQWTGVSPEGCEEQDD